MCKRSKNANEGTFLYVTLFKTNILEVCGMLLLISVT